MKKFLSLAVFIIGCELTGLISTPLTISSVRDWYAFLNKPFFAPPNWLFGPAWILLYLLMGISAWIIWQKGWTNPRVQTALKFFIAQLALNFIWTPIFFGLHRPLVAFADIVALWVAIILTMAKFYPISKNAAFLLVPYLAWVSFASLLNLSIVALNR